MWRKQSRTTSLQVRLSKPKLTVESAGILATRLGSDSWTTSNPVRQQRGAASGRPLSAPAVHVSVDLGENPQVLRLPGSIRQCSGIKAAQRGASRVSFLSTQPAVQVGGKKITVHELPDVGEAVLSERNQNLKISPNSGKF